MTADVQEMYGAFREAGYCIDCWVNLNEEPHEPKCPLASIDQGDTDG